MEREILIIFALTVFTVTLIANMFYTPQRTTIYAKIRSVADQAEDPRTFAERVLRPAWEKAKEKMRPKTIPRELLREQLLFAGLQNQMTPEDFVLRRLIEGLVLAAVPLVRLLIWPSIPALSIVIASGMSGYLIMNLWLARTIKARQQQIQKEIVPFVELMALASEAGLHVTEALKHVCREMDGLLATEWRRALQAIERGQTRNEAITALAQRNGVEELNHLVGLLLQSDQLGVPMADALSIQARQLRLYRRNRITEKAHKVELKMLFPLLFFVLMPFAALLIAPALMQFLRGMQ